jgi:hypothetical protein
VKRVAVQLSLAAVAFVLLFGACSALAGCWWPAASAAPYGAELAACTAQSKTCAESIACENRVRASRGRPLRDADAGCK